METEFEVIAHTEYRDGAVYRTKVITTIWLPVPHRKSDSELTALAIQHGGNNLQPTGKWR